VLEVGFQMTERYPGLDWKVKLRIRDAKQPFQPTDIKVLQYGILRFLI
jgi:hypothetical protein